MNVLTYKGYMGRFEYAPDSDAFHGHVLHLTDAITFQGRSIDELKTALAESVEDYFDLCKEIGKEPQKPFSGRFNVRISPEIHRRIAMEAAKDGVSINSWVSKTLSNAVEHSNHA